MYRQNPVPYSDRKRNKELVPYSLFGTMCIFDIGCVFSLILSLISEVLSIVRKCNIENSIHFHQNGFDLKKVSQFLIRIEKGKRNWFLIPYSKVSVFCFSCPCFSNILCTFYNAEAKRGIFLGFPWMVVTCICVAPLIWFCR